MVFNSWAFATFFIVALTAYYLIRNWTAQKSLLLALSYVFYGFFHAPYVLILLVSTAVDYFLGHRIAAARGGMRKLFLAMSLLSNLGMLAYFKYADFLLENVTEAAGNLGFNYAPPDWNIVLPVGISYYTFQTLSYSIDVYRGKIEPSKSLLNFAFFVAFFPQLVAGPIVRAADFLPQTAEPKRATFYAPTFFWGNCLLIFGLFGKIVLADRLFAPVVDTVYADPATATFMSSWIATLSFSGQIFFDFAGYSLAAIGVAMCFGFALPDNFRFPYAAAGFSDFWRRWHISLSEWLRDYLYISLGGNRLGTVRTYFNLAATMLLGGLWHGAAWTFVIWGALHGTYLIAERLLSAPIRIAHRFLRQFGVIVGILITYFFVCIAWVFFRASSFQDAALMLRAMASPDASSWAFHPFAPVAVLVIVITLVVHYCMRNTSIEAAWKAMPLLFRAFILGGAVFLILSTRGEQRAFIYFQF